MSVAATIPSLPPIGPSDFTDLVRRYQGLVCAVAYSATGDRAVSEEVAQEAFLVAWRKLPEMAEPPVMPGWLCGIARNLARNARRKLGRERPDPERAEAAVDGQPTPLDSAADRESADLVWRALDDLPDDVREPLVLFYRSEQSVREVADNLGLSEEAARQRLSRGRKALKAGVAEMVERALAASKPGAAFTAAVVAALGKDALAAPAAAAPTSAAASGPAAILLPIALVAGAVALGVTLWVARSSASSPAPARAQATLPAPAKSTPPAAVRVVRGEPTGPRARPPAAAALAPARRAALPRPAGASAEPLDQRASLERRIDLDFAEANAGDILHMLSDVSGVPIIVRDTIEPRVNMQVKDRTALAVLDDLLEQVGATRSEIPVLRVLPGSPTGADQLAGEPFTATFDSTPLAAVMEIFSRHLDVPIAVDPSLAEVQITAQFERAPLGAAFASVLAQANAGFETDFGYEITLADE
ncbi:MAG TPA: sigma-70 family RNA polymerase sigma factor [Kofleriaceae bacterium]